MKKCRLFFLLLVVISGSINVYAQQYQIKGKVIGNSSNKPIEFVNAVLMKKDSVYSGAVTDSLGVFIITAPKGDYTLKLEYFGEAFTKKGMNISNDVDLGILKVKESTELQEVVINVKRKIIKQVGDKLQFDVENSPFAKGNSAGELLSKTPKIMSDGSSGFKVKNKAALVLINGRKMNLSPEDLQAYLSTINSENIKRIEVQETADATQDGSIKNGVINIVLKNNPKGLRLVSKQYMKYYTKENQHYVSGWNAQYGSEKLYMYTNLNFQKETNRGASFTHFFHNDGTKQFSDGIFENNQKYFNSQIGAVYYINPKNELGISLTYNQWKNDYDEPGEFTVTKPNQMQIVSDGLSLTRMLVKNRFAQFNYTLKLDEKGSDLRVLSDMGENYFSNSSQVDTRYPNILAKDNHIQTNGLSKSRYLSSQVDYNQTFDDGLGLLIGAKFNTIFRDNEQKNFILENQKWNPQKDKNQNFTSNEKIYATYASGSKQWGSNFLKLGLRMEYTNMNGNDNITGKGVGKRYTDWFPSFYYKYDFNKNISANVNYRRSISRPSFSDLTPYIFKTNDFQYSEGNPELKPYYTNSYKLGFDYKKYSLTFGFQKTTDYIRDIYITNSDKINIVKPANSGVEELWSADYTYADNVTKWLYINLSAGIFNGKYDLPEGRFQGTNWYENIFARVKLPNDWSIEAEHRFQSNETSFNNRSRYNTSTDFSIRKTLLNNSLLLFFRVQDVFNSKRTDLVSYYPDFHYQFYMKPTTRNFTFLIQYTFDNKNKIKKQSIESSDEVRGRL
ncbi:outer membrane beta-barrel family protein [Riemerella anatipestifer]|uniref:outer membrane beta-barrel family protein n=1 Tax=Riemerella anatipestifer TaxID=34085 RepID=UPI00129E883F|nr:outer membrane beta-barrel family protein [Riemerella anatipestifer]MRM82356.1 TonB-dependent receptor [Riemerella anatipestifer]